MTYCVQKAPKPKRGGGNGADWGAWIRGMGSYTRRLRTLVGVSQEELAARAGVSQGAVSRLEAGRAVNTPLITVMKINAAMRDALTALGPDLLSEETRRIMDVGARGTPITEDGFEAVPLTVHPLLADVVQLFWQVPERHRGNFIVLMRAAAQMLTETVTT